jgi:hypothetical protein
MKCERCGSPTRAPRTSEVEGGAVVVRIRVCTSGRCGWSFSTTERRCNLAAPPPARRTDDRR